MNTQPNLSPKEQSDRARTEADMCHPYRRIQAAAVRQMCGGISDMTLWRWMDNPTLDFPRPTYIGRRRFWREAEIVDWLDAQAKGVAQPIFTQK
jgi:predicted DNA-binding transcriptional regulator AlpA